MSTYFLDLISDFRKQILMDNWSLGVNDLEELERYKKETYNLIYTSIVSGAYDKIPQRIEDNLTLHIKKTYNWILFFSDKFQEKRKYLIDNDRNKTLSEYSLDNIENELRNFREIESVIHELLDELTILYVKYFQSAKQSPILKSYLERKENFAWQNINLNVKADFNITKGDFLKELNLKLVEDSEIKDENKTQTTEINDNAEFFKTIKPITQQTSENAQYPELVEDLKKLNLKGITPYFALFVYYLQKNEIKKLKGVQAEKGCAISHELDPNTFYVKYYSTFKDNSADCLQNREKYLKLFLKKIEARNLLNKYGILKLAEKDLNDVKNSTYSK